MEKPKLSLNFTIDDLRLLRKNEKSDTTKTA